jgi:hypothetical protein
MVLIIIVTRTIKQYKLETAGVEFKLFQSPTCQKFILNCVTWKDVDAENK